MDAILKTKTFGAAVQNAAKRGVKVKILLWNPPFGVSFASVPAWILAAQQDNEDCRDAFTKPSGRYYDPNIAVQLKTHSTYKGSRHTKTLIFGAGDGCTVIVTGTNVETMENSGAPHLGGKYHDAGVELEGPVTRDVEDDFKSHWNGTAEGPSATSSAEIVPVKIVVTDYDANRADIQAELVNRISAAQQLVYMENFTIRSKDR